MKNIIIDCHTVTEVNDTIKNLQLGGYNGKITILGTEGFVNEVNELSHIVSVTPKQVFEYMGYEVMPISFNQE